MRRNPRHPEIMGRRSSSRLNSVKLDVQNQQQQQQQEQRDEDIYESLPFMEKTYRGLVRPNIVMLYHYANSRFFDNEIKGFTIRYAPNLASCYGSTSKYNNVISISWKIHSYFRRKRFSTLMGSLIHEMVHAWMYNYVPRDCDEDNESHGPLYTKKLSEIAKRAAKFKYNLFNIPACQFRDLQIKIRRYRWRCSVCDKEKTFLVSRDINRDPLLSRHECRSVSPGVDDDSLWLRVSDS